MNRSLNIVKFILLSGLSIGVVAICTHLFNNISLINSDILEEKSEAIEKVKQIISQTQGGVFMYTQDYAMRFLLTSNVEINNPLSAVIGDVYFEQLLKYNMRGVCTVTQTQHLPIESDLYQALAEKDLIKENMVYIACPIFFPEKRLVGYLSNVINIEELTVSEALQRIRYESILVQEKMEEIL